jgi:hypothetical protein
MNKFGFAVENYAWTINIERTAQRSLVLFFILTLFQLVGHPPPAEARDAIGRSLKRKQVARLGTSQPSSTNSEAPSSSARVEPSPALSERAVLYEEDPAKTTSEAKYVGSVVWHTEAIKHDVGQQADVAVYADVNIPDRKLKTTMSIFPASQTIDFSFVLPADFGNGGSIFDVPGVLMKPDEVNRGAPLSGSTVKVSDVLFRFKLSNVDAARSRNLMLLKEAPWFSIPIVYNNLHRAIIVIEKGKSGYKALAAAFGP